MAKTIEQVLDTQVTVEANGFVMWNGTKVCDCNKQWCQTVMHLLMDAGLKWGDETHHKMGHYSSLHHPFSPHQPFSVNEERTTTIYGKIEMSYEINIPHSVLETMIDNDEHPDDYATIMPGGANWKGWDNVAEQMAQSLIIKYTNKLEAKSNEFVGGQLTSYDSRFKYINPGDMTPEGGEFGQNIEHLNQ